MLPSFLVVGMGINSTKILIMSQVVLSFGIALAIIPLLVFTNSKAIMGRFYNRKATSIIGNLIVTLVIILNVFLLYSFAI